MPPDGTRRSGRIPKEIAIAVIGSDLDGRVFSERTKTVVLSRHGAGIVSSYTLSAEQELVIRNEETQKEIEARVVGQIGADGSNYIYGIAFLDETKNFWGVNFPEMSESEMQARRTLLECGSCRAREFADHSDLASDVMAINESIVRYCKRCGSSTLWKQAPAGMAPTEAEFGAPTASRPPDRQPPSEAQGHSSFAGAAWLPADASEQTGKFEPVTVHVAAKTQIRSEAPVAAPSHGGVATKEQENRRKHARTRVNYKACVRRPNTEDDIVACEDMSKGGLRFKSSRKYFEKTLIEVAVPYAPGDQAIFVPAQIVYVQELPELKMHRCGVMYLRSGR